MKDDCGKASCNHNYQKLHTNESCAVCYWEDIKAKVLKKYPHYEHNDNKLMEACMRLSDGRRL